MKLIEEIIKKIQLIDIAALIFISTGILLYNPYKLIEILKMEQFVEKYQIFFGILFILSSAFLIKCFIKKIYEIFNINIISPILVRKNIRNLTEEEMNHLRKYFYDEKSKKFLKSAYVPWSNGYTTSLSSKHIIYWSGGKTALMELIKSEQCVPYNLSMPAYKKLNKTNKKIENNNSKK